MGLQNQKRRVKILKINDRIEYIHHRSSVEIIWMNKHVIKREENKKPKERPLIHWSGYSKKKKKKQSVHPSPQKSDKSEQSSVQHFLRETVR